MVVLTAEVFQLFIKKKNSSDRELPRDMFRFKPSRITLVGILFHSGILRSYVGVSPKIKKKVQTTWKYVECGICKQDPCFQIRKGAANTQDPKLFYSRCYSSSPNKLLFNISHGNVICMSAFFRVGQFAVYQVQQ